MQTSGARMRLCPPFTFAYRPDIKGLVHRGRQREPCTSGIDKKGAWQHVSVWWPGLRMESIQHKAPCQVGLNWIQCTCASLAYQEAGYWCALPDAQVSKPKLDNGRRLKSHLRQCRILSPGCLARHSSDPISWLLRTEASNSDLVASQLLCIPTVVAVFWQLHISLAFTVQLSHLLCFITLSLLSHSWRPI